MNFKAKLLQASNRCDDLTIQIKEFRDARPKLEADWSDYDRSKIYLLESKLRDAKRHRQNVENEIHAKGLKKDHRTGKFVRI